MRILILTSSLSGTASHHIKFIINCKEIQIAMVIYNLGVIKQKSAYYKKKLKKVFKIGLLGTLNGFRMRKWFTTDVHKYLDFPNLKSFCNNNSIRFENTPSINSEQTIELFNEANADLGISLGNPYISEKVFTRCKYGMINIHHEILPKFQNAQSIIWEIYEGSKNTGFTIHKIDKHIDTGEILLQKEVPIIFRNSLRDTVSYTSTKLLEASANGLTEILRQFKQNFNNAKPQGAGKIYTTPSIWKFLKIYFNYKKLKHR